MATVEIQNLIGGDLLGTASRTEVWNPARPSEVVATYPLATADDAAAAVEAATAALPSWAGLPGPRRGEFLRRAADALEQAPGVAENLSRESGKIITEARGEVARAVQVLRYFSGETAQPTGHTIPSTRAGTLLYTTREPLGVVGVVTPWNFPLAIPAWKIAPALAFGNTVAFKPSSLAPASGWALVDAFRQAGLPDGVLNFVTGYSSDVGPALTGSSVDAISFTGSGAVGAAIREGAARSGVKVQAELGGKNPTVVLDDADLARAVDITLGAAMRMAGQKCTATSRAIVSEPIYGEFAALIADRAAALRVGDPLDTATYLGPLITADEKERVLEEVQRGVDDGGRLLAGGDGPDAEGHFVNPTVLDGLGHESSLAQDEVFGPVLVVLPAQDDEHAVEIANSVRYGLSASVVSNDLTRVMRMVDDIQAGVVKVNSESAGVEYQAPFGGMKDSGSHTREQGKAAMEFFTQTKTVYVDPMRN